MLRIILHLAEKRHLASQEDTSKYPFIRPQIVLYQ